MNNINFIYRKTNDGHNLTLDGFRVESFETFENDKGDDDADDLFCDDDVVIRAE